MHFNNLHFPQYAPGRYLARIMIELPMSMESGALRSMLKSRGINTRPGYPAQVSHLGYVAERWLLEVPSGNEIDDIEAFEICAIISCVLEALHRPASIAQ